MKHFDRIKCNSICVTTQWPLITIDISSCTPAVSKITAEKNGVKYNPII